MSIKPTRDISSLDDLSKSFNDWSSIDKMIKEFSEKLKELKQKKIDLQEKNMEFMMVNDLDSVQLGHGEEVKLIMTRNKLSNVTKARLPSKLEKYFEEKKKYDHEKSINAVKEIMEFLEEDPVYVESSYLKKYEEKG